MSWITSLAIIPLETLAVVLLADFATGFVHWLEDAYGEPDWPVTGKLFTQPNILHHYKPRHFLCKNWWQSSWDLLLINSTIVLAAFLLHRLNWQIALFALVATNANQLHKWAHQTPRENGRIVTWMQKWKIIQGTRHHARHHTDPKNSHYCTITVLVNPMLDAIRFWDGLEWLIYHATGVKRRIDPTVKVERHSTVQCGA